MKVNGIIAEYNPFHNGHKYHLDASKSATGADYTIVVMSGNFVQRGAPALMDKHARTEMALRCGADLVLELPALYATASAEYFAAGAVALLDKLGVVTHLSFGSECGDVELLSQIAALLSEESEDYANTFKRFLKQGMSYPNARTWTLMQHYPHLNIHKDVFSSPNNILGIEYCKALHKRNSPILPVTLKRAGATYHEKGLESPLCSALAIRQALSAGTDITALSYHMPREAFLLLQKHSVENAFLQADDFSTLLYYKLLLERKTGYDTYLDVSDALSERIRNKLNAFTDYNSFCDLLKTKDMTYTRISRCLLHILLHIKKEDMELGKSLDYTPYARILGFRRDSTDFLSAIKEHSSIPLISKLADAESILEKNAYQLLQTDILIGEIYAGVVSGRTGKTAKNEFTTPIVIV